MFHNSFEFKFRQGLIDLLIYIFISVGRYITLLEKLCDIIYQSFAERCTFPKHCPDVTIPNLRVQPAQQLVRSSRRKSVTTMTTYHPTFSSKWSATSWLEPVRSIGTNEARTINLIPLLLPFCKHKNHKLMDEAALLLRCLFFLRSA